MSIKEVVFGTLVTVVVGGTVYTVSQENIVDNFVEYTGLTQEQAEEYIDSIEEGDLVSFDEIGLSYVGNGEEILESLSEVDCENFVYEFESDLLSCDLAKEQLEKLGNDLISLGEAYRKLDMDSATKEDISIAVQLTDVYFENYKSPVIELVYDEATITELKNGVLYNKALLQALLDSE
jgi:hypothetical protein